MVAQFSGNHPHQKPFIGLFAEGFSVLLFNQFIECFNLAIILCAIHAFVSQAQFFLKLFFVFLLANIECKLDIEHLCNTHNIRDNKTFRTFLRLCAFRAGQLLNFNELARDTGVSHTTARNGLSILEASFVFFTLPPFFENFGKRLIKSPKCGNTYMD